MESKELPKLTPSEFEIMAATWKAGELTVTEVLNAVNAQKNVKLKRATIQVQIARLEEKGWLTHREERNKFYYRATVDRDKASGEIVEDVKERVFGGSCVELVKSLFKSSDITGEEIVKLREMIDKKGK